jgi:hypothetical protein
MIRYQIPKAFLPGFRALSQINSEEAAELAARVEKLPVGADVKEFQIAIKEETGLSETSFLSANAIFSLGGLLLDDEGEVEQLAEDLSDAFCKGSKEEVSPAQKEQLRQNLITIFKKAENLKKTFKAYQLLLENTHNYQKSRVITDMRLIFEDDFNKVPQSGLIIHQLKLEYLENNEQKAFFITLDSNNILKLKEDLNRAIEKEACIKRDYDKVHFINIR